MKRKPRRFSSLLIAFDSSVWAGISPVVVHVFTFGSPPTNDQSSSESGTSSSSVARAFPITDSILPRWRTMPASPSSRSTSRSPKRAIASTSQPANACR